MSRDINKRCGATINHQPHWHHAKDGLDYWCDGKKVSK